ncbi:hypothetical protein U9M48_008997 [Paspalum notatum var. saurae]|uniref:BED-type domain-containing protein n=1 Tax=Paspalum notatum var. saurae TaxID=547442 RepID=A0AAQ3WEE3_PASNO
MERRYDPTSTNHELVLMGVVPNDEDDGDAGRDDLFGETPDAPIDVGDGPERVQPDANGEPGGAAATASTTKSTGRKRKSTSPVWEDMDEIFETVNGVQVRVAARCHYCKKELSARSSGGTGHLSRHVEKCKLRHGIGRAGHRSMLRFNADGNVIKWEYCEILDLPLCFGESEAFEEYIKTAHNPRHVNVSRQTTTRDIEKYFKEQHAKLAERLKSVSCVALTSDIWSGNAKEDYLSVVAHFVNSDWELEKRILTVRLIDCSHSGSNIAERISTVLGEYGLIDKVFSITLDNASSNTTAMDTLKPLLSGYVGPLLMHQRCGCHIINLFVKSAFDVLKLYLDDFRTAVSFLNSSNQRIAAYKSFCIAMSVRPRKFGLDMDVRWNSTYLMIKHLIPYRSTFDVFIQTHYPQREEGALLTNDHWYVGEKILEFLERFYDFTVVTSGIYYPTSPLMLHHILSMLTHLNEYEHDNLLGPTVAPMKEKFQKYWGEIPLLYSFVFILDLRAKLRGFNNVLFLLSKLNCKNYSDYLTTVRAGLFDLFKKYDDKFGGAKLQRASNSTPGEGTGNSGLTNAPGLGANPMNLSSNPSLLSRRTSASALLHAASTNAGIAGTELSSYADSDTVQKFDDDFDILDWWRDRKITYPVLSILAKDILSVPVSTVTSESAFSLVSRVIEERRCRLAPSMVEMLSLVKD